MAYDIQLEKSIDAYAGQWRLTKRGMFGGLAYFTPGDNMCFAILSEGLIFRVGQERTAQYAALPDVREAAMGKRVMKNWLLANGAALRDEARLRVLLEAGYAFASALPPKN